MITQTSAPVRAVSVRYDGGERYEITMRGHTVAVDQPTHEGGGDSGPTPVELFVASLAGCAAYYAGRYLSRHGLTRDGLAVTATYTMADDRPARVGGVRLAVRVPDALPVGRRPGLRAVVEHCTVHNSLTTPPTVNVDLVD